MTQLKKVERAVMIQSLPPVQGLPKGSRYMLTPFHQDVCKCCVTLSEIRERERKSNKKHQEKLKDRCLKEQYGLVHTPDIDLANSKEWSNH